MLPVFLCFYLSVYSFTLVKFESLNDHDYERGHDYAYAGGALDNIFFCDPSLSGNNQIRGDIATLPHSSWHFCDRYDVGACFLYNNRVYFFHSPGLSNTAFSYSDGDLDIPNRRRIFSLFLILVFSKSDDLHFRPPHGNGEDLDDRFFLPVNLDNNRGVFPHNRYRYNKDSAGLDWA